MRWRPDPLVTGIIIAMILGLVVKLPQRAHDVFSVVADLSVATVFLVYGMRIRTRDVLDGLRHITLQSSVLSATYVLFPILGFALGQLVGPWLGSGFATGFLYLSLLPSTIQSSVTFVSIARGKCCRRRVRRNHFQHRGHLPHPAARSAFLAHRRGLG